ncbi:hypothetical protein ACFL3S_08460 [Gemmatimonadota bacterium]
MKEPWEVYFNSVEGDVRGRAMPEPPVDPEGDEAGKFLAAFEIARSSTVYSLIRDLHWVESDAVRLADEFFRNSIDWLNHAQDAGLISLRMRLRNHYTRWVLNWVGSGRTRGCRKPNPALH